MFGMSLNRLDCPRARRRSTNSKKKRPDDVSVSRDGWLVHIQKRVNTRQGIHRALVTLTVTMAEDPDEWQSTPLKLHEPPRRSERREICASLHRVTVHHPGYVSTRLFEISAFDGESGGFHHGTLLLLCGIIAGGAWNGWLSEEKNGTRITTNTEAVLTKRDYYYHLPDPQWPVVLSLDHLTFPHGRPPPGWTFDNSRMMSSFYSSASVSSMSQAVRDRDMACRVTRWADGMERAHLCPRSAVGWFTREELERYNIRSTLLVDDMANAVALRQDVHTELDKGTFIFVRKQGKWVSHFLDPTHDLGPEYHNVPIDMPTAVSEAFVFANIAIAILPRISNFLTRGEKRKVIVKKGNDPSQIIEMAGTDIRTMLDQSKRQRSMSPRKRQRDVDVDCEPREAQSEKPLYSDQTPRESHEIPSTPTLSVFKTSSDLAASASNEVKSYHPCTKIELLRMRALQEQRRLNKTMACCDYDAFEEALRGDVRGHHSNTQLCIYCLGAEAEELSDA